MIPHIIVQTSNVSNILSYFTSIKLLVRKQLGGNKCIVRVLRRNCERILERESEEGVYKNVYQSLRNERRNTRE